MVNSGRGRRSGPTHTRERILQAAQNQFLTLGYDATTVRSVAREAGVDHAMVNYWFGSKEGLLRAVLDLVVIPGQILERVVAAEPEDLATALLSTAISLWDRPEVMATVRPVMLSALEGGREGRVVREYLGHLLTERLSTTIGGRDASARTAAAAACMAGMFVTRYVLRVEPIVSMSGPEAVRAIAPSLRAALGAPGRGPR